MPKGMSELTASTQFILNGLMEVTSPMARESRLFYALYAQFIFGVPLPELFSLEFSII